MLLKVKKLNPHISSKISTIIRCSLKKNAVLQSSSLKHNLSKLTQMFNKFTAFAGLEPKLDCCLEWKLLACLYQLNTKWTRLAGEWNAWIEVQLEFCVRMEIQIELAVQLLFYRQKLVLDVLYFPLMTSGCLTRDGHFKLLELFGNMKKRVGMNEKNGKEKMRQGKFSSWILLNDFSWN